VLVWIALIMLTVDLIMLTVDGVRSQRRPSVLADSANSIAA
jgi:heme exporter protein D